FWVAVFGTQMLATLIAVYGVLMTPLGWGWALFVWGYAVAWFLVNDRLKLLGYRIFDPAKANVPTKLTVQIAKPTPALACRPLPDIEGIAKAPLPAWIVACTLAAVTA